ncbi:MAG TPA: helix-turn-helix domain-containing protein [Coriobacteriia bacterium]|nr:helix-turn-helix domain-containing protein [Coriobacteriia bacterium]
MGATNLTQETYLPPRDEQAAKVYDFFAAHEAARGERPGPQYFLSGAEPGDQVALPAEVYEIVRKVVDAMRSGLAVYVAPLSQKLTTQQAADLLGVSRPTLVKYLDTDRLLYERIGSHRRLYLCDVLAFREERRREQYAVLEATSFDLDDEDDLASTLESLRAARRSVGGSRRARM